MTWAAGTGRASLNYVGRELASVGTDFHLQFNGWLAGAAVYLTVVAVALVVLLFVVGSVVGVGYAKFNLDLVDGQEANVSRLFGYFPWWKTALVASLLQGVLILLWSLLLIIPGIGGLAQLRHDGLYPGGEPGPDGPARPSSSRKR